MNNNVNALLTETEEVILNSLANALFNANKTIPSHTDWQLVYEESISQAVMPLVFTENDYLPFEIQKQYENQKLLTWANNIKSEQEHIQLDKILQSEQIPYVILKGSASAHYYPNPILRTMGDVDFLVQTEDFERTGTLLRQKGYTSWEQNHTCHEVYQKGKSHLEMHFEPAGIPFGTAGELVRDYLKDVIEQAKECHVQEGSYMVPTDFHHGLIILLHTSHHMTGEGIGLRHLCDWAVFVSSLTNEQFCQLFEKKLKDIGMWYFAQVLTSVSIRFLGCPNREWVGTPDSKLVNSIIKDIFKGGNFGYKDNQRSQETFLISSRGKNGIGKDSMLKQLIVSMNQIVYLKWPISERIVFLLPLGWLFYGGRYLVRSILGRRPRIHAHAVVRGAEERRKIYQQLKIFESTGE